MQRGYYRKRELEDSKTATLLAAIYNTIPKKKGGKVLTAADFLEPKGESVKVSIEDRRKLADQMLENSKRFDRGVIYTKM